MFRGALRRGVWIQDRCLGYVGCYGSFSLGFFFFISSEAKRSGVRLKRLLDRRK